MINYLSASYVYPVSSDPLRNGVVALDDEGNILAVMTEAEAEKRGITDITFYEGLLVPGFVNTHCHLELSGLRGEIPQHTGLAAFVQSVMKLRGAQEYDMELAMLEADKEMLKNGIVAVGDISNLAISRSIKQNSPIYYHTFLEVMGFSPAAAEAAMHRALEFRENFAGLPLSIVPHAPYSVSKDLFEKISLAADTFGGPLSLHNQETPDENAFFEHKGGGFPALYEFLGLDIGFYQPSGKTSLQTVLPLLSSKQKILLVHNTVTSREDVQFADALHPDLYWCLCPNANLYIENRLPDVEMLRNEGLRITLGTDSLASNTGLSIFAEMKTLQDHFDVPVSELIRWASWNGADFLGILEVFGSLETGKRPGINVLDFEEKEGKILLGNTLKKIR